MGEGTDPMWENLRNFFTLPITTDLHQPGHPQNNLCLSRLRPRGVCCAHAGVGMHLVHACAPRPFVTFS